MIMRVFSLSQKIDNSDMEILKEGILMDDLINEKNNLSLDVRNKILS